MKTIEERANEYIGHPFEVDEDVSITMARGSYAQGATEQKAIDMELIPQLYVRWLMIDGEKPSWVEYANKAMGD